LDPDPELRTPEPLEPEDPLEEEPVRAEVPEPEDEEDPL